MSRSRVHLMRLLGASVAAASVGVSLVCAPLGRHVSWRPLVRAEGGRAVAGRTLGGIALIDSVYEDVGLG